MLYDTEFKEHDVDGAAAFIVRCRAPDNGRMRVHELPAVTVAAAIHHGSYGTIHLAHEAVQTWIQANGYRIAGPDRELYLYNSMPITQDNPTYVTDVQYPIEGVTEMIGKPKIEERGAQPYAGIRTQVPMRQFKKVIPQCLGEIFAWLEARGLAPAGAPFMRFHVINMTANMDMDIELGVPVASAITGDGRVAAGTLPAGRYASLVYTGVKNGIKGNKALLEWGAKQGLVWERYASEKGDGFGARYESYLTNPHDEPDQAKWETEVAIKLAA